MIRLMQALRDVKPVILGLAVGWFFLNPIITSTYSDKTLTGLLVDKFDLLSVIGFLVLTSFIVTLKYFILIYRYPNQD